VHKAEATVRLSRGKLFADARENDVYAAVDGLIDKLSRQVTKHKEKLTDHHARDVGKSRYR
jgi:putative sigma-54 modulation protein